MKLKRHKDFLITENVSEDSIEFASLMYNNEEKAKQKNTILYDEYEQESGNLWRELNVENWEEAFKADPMSCYAHKEKLDSICENINENVTKEDILSYLEKEGCSSELIDFLKNNLDLINKQSPRKWKQVSDVAKKVGLTKALETIISKEVSELVEESLNEAVLQKDLDRMHSIVKKAKGNKDSEINYARSMANAIKDKNKAYQRGLAAIEVLDNKEAAEHFFNRAQELGLDCNLNQEISKRGLEKFGMGVIKLGSKMTKMYDQAQGKGTRVSGSISSIGSVNIQTGECKYFNVYDTWPDSTAEVWKDDNGKLKLLFTSGKKPMGDIGAIGNFQDNQTWREIGYGWELVEWVAVKNLKELLRVFNKKTFFGYTYK